jgi:hypothetical protein
MYSQLLSENEYLRFASERVIGSFNSYCGPLRNYLSENNPNEEYKDEPELAAKQKAFHKRQKTHINFGLMQGATTTCENIESENSLNESNLSTSTVVDTKVICFKIFMFRKETYLILP